MSGDQVGEFDSWINHNVLCRTSPGGRYLDVANRRG
jgi:hypothetical protein